MRWSLIRAMAARRAAGWRGLAAVLPVAVLCSCGTEQTGAPSTVGALAAPAPQGGLEVTIRSDRPQVRLGDMVRFNAVVKNVGSTPVWVPKKLALIYAWTYPTGSHDNMLLMVPRSVAFSEDNAQLLQPGQEIAQTSEIQTQYFPKAGITEFVALLQIPENSNTALTPFAASGRYPSNGCGVEIVPR